MKTMITLSCMNAPAGQRMPANSDMFPVPIPGFRSADKKNENCRTSGPKKMFVVPSGDPRFRPGIVRGIVRVDQGNAGQGVGISSLDFILAPAVEEIPARFGRVSRATG